MTSGRAGKSLTLDVIPRSRFKECCWLRSGCGGTCDRGFGLAGIQRQRNVKGVCKRGADARDLEQARVEVETDDLREAEDLGV